MSFLKKFIKKSINFVRRKIYPIKGVVPLSINNAEAYYGGRKDVKIYKGVEDSGIIDFAAKSLSEDSRIAFGPFRSRSEFVLIDSTDHKFSFRNNHILDEKGRVVYEPCIPSKNFTVLNEVSEKCEKINGTVAYLSNTAPHSYGHFLRVRLPMLRLYWKFIDKKDIDFYYLGSQPATDFQLEMFDLIGIKKDKLVCYPCRARRSLTVVRFNEKYNNAGKYIDSNSYNFVREQFLPLLSKNDSYPKRIFVRRGKTKKRNIVNEEEVVRCLEGYNFEPIVMDGLPFLQQANIFFNADIVIGLEGSALANLIFIRKGAKVIVIFPSQYLLPSTYTYAAYQKADFYNLLVDSVPGGTGNPQQDNVIVDVNKLKKLLKLAEVT